MGWDFDHSVAVMPVGGKSHARPALELDEDDGVAIGLASSGQGGHHAAGIQIPSAGESGTGVVESSAVGVRCGDGQNEPGRADVTCLGTRHANLRLHVAEPGDDFDRDEAAGGTQNDIDRPEIAGKRDDGLELAKESVRDPVQKAVDVLELRRIADATAHRVSRDSEAKADSRAVLHERAG